MTIPKQVIRQRDFSAGEITPEAKRRDDVDVLAGGVRTSRNWQVVGAGNLRERFGRVAEFLCFGRVENVRLSATERVFLAFNYDAGTASGRATVYSAAGAQIATQTGYAWTNATVGQISFCVINRDVVIAFPGQRLKRIRIPVGLGGATFADFTFATGLTGRLEQPFYRFPESIGITIQPSARTGSITLTASAPWFNAGHVGTIFRWAGRQVLITAFSSSTSVTGTVLETLPQETAILISSSVTGFEVGQVIEGELTGTRGQIVSISIVGPDQFINAVINKPGRSDLGGTFEPTETIVGPLGSAVVAGVTDSVPLSASTQWDESFINDYRGWPRSVTNDRGRLILCDFPQLPEAIAWSAVNGYDDFYVDAASDSAIVEFVPGKARAIYVQGGADQFVFTDRGVYYIPISAAQPLKPGSVEFRQITSEGCASVRPVDTPEGTIFVVAGGRRVAAIVGTGQSARPYISRDVSKYHSHLFTGIVALAVSQGEGDLRERYIYAVNASGVVCIGRFESTREWIGWHRWDGAGVATWVTAEGSNVHFCVSYSQGAVTAQVVERMDGSALLDAQIPLGAIPAPMVSPLSYGPFWWLPNAMVTVMLNGRDYGDRATDAYGNIVWLDNDDSAAPGWVAGFTFTCELEPFVPHTDPGQSFRQSMRKRRVAASEISVWHSAPFIWDNRITPVLQWGVNFAAAPAVREASYSFRHLGRSADPRLVLTRERPGQLSIIEVAMEVTI
ncbi:MAG: hypothetical protein ACRCTG_15460 [Aestuariivirga sp.]